MLRELAPDDGLETHFNRRRNRPLLCRQHALCGAGHLHPGADECHLPYVLRFADEGLPALSTDPGFAAGLNVIAGS
jgi:hypothetical protein